VALPSVLTIAMQGNYLSRGLIVKSLGMERQKILHFMSPNPKGFPTSSS
jgi:hypothetical protein